MTNKGRSNIAYELNSFVQHCKVDDRYRIYTQDFGTGVTSKEGWNSYSNKGKSFLLWRFRKSVKKKG